MQINGDLNITGGSHLTLDATALNVSGSIDIGPSSTFTWAGQNAVVNGTNERRSMRGKRKWNEN